MGQCCDVIPCNIDVNIDIIWVYKMSLEQVRQQVNELIDSEDVRERGIITSQALFNIYQILIDRNRFDVVLLKSLNNYFSSFPFLGNIEAEVTIRVIELELRTVAA